ncbi:MAG: diaminopimelate decarboxylase [Lactobacillales bacterium]|jgi:diaminopimelate decarboxylase|nr:diaminopimelate decarboxylase [Lactobacillales bacterium]
MLLGTSKYNAAGHLEIGGVEVRDLAEQYDTPLFIYDIKHVKNTINNFKKIFVEQGVAYKIKFASKAFCNVSFYELLAREGVGCDVVSAGELYTALRGGIEASEIEFHGNNKTPDELEYALSEGVVIVIDNFLELALINEIAEELDVQVTAQMRVAPGVEAATHDAIKTGQVDSKFGFDVQSGQHTEALKMILNESPRINLTGIHCHIGSQIFDTSGFVEEVKVMFEILKSWKEEFGFESTTLNVGGGFGVHYTEEDAPVAPEEFVKIIVETAKNYFDKLPEIWIEPGRSLVAEAGTTLYTVGSQKVIPGINHYVSIDGGMGDNLRPALYGSLYEAYPAIKPESEIISVDICGKYCESGDIIIRRAQLPTLNAGELLAVNSTGAYGYSMSTNYNRNLKPAVVFVEDGESRLVARRETFEDQIRLEVENG